MEPLKPEFRQMLRDLLGESEGDKLCAALDTEPIHAVKLNPAKWSDIQTLFPEAQTIATAPLNGYILPTRPNFALMPEWHGGAFYVQEPSSMVYGLIADYLSQQFGDRDLRWLDLCAAPGGKTTSILSNVSAGSIIVANEFDSRRASVLVENLTKWGDDKVVVTTGDTAKFRRTPDAFHIVSVDAPCSGEGMMRKDEEARRQWSPGLVKQCAELQREILANAWEALSPGGYLIYSTCTFNRTENEDNVKWMIEEFGAENPPLPDFGGTESIDPDVKAIRFMPHVSRGEGLFVALLRKPGVLKEKSFSLKKNVKRTLPEPAKKALDKILYKEIYEAEIDKEGNLYCFPKNQYPFINYVREKIGAIKYGGIWVGTVKGKDFLPSPALAFSTDTKEDAFPELFLNREEALDYLRKGTSGAMAALERMGNAPKGYFLVFYKTIPLGFIKNLGNRVNNLYPSNWRLRQN